MLQPDDLLIFTDDPPMRSIDIVQHILFWLNQTSVQYPVKCGICRAKTKGNIIIGYRMGCLGEDCY